MSPRALFQFGWESELTPPECARLLAYYRPLGGGWRGHTGADRIAWLESAIAARGLGDKGALLEKEAGAPAGLPPQAFRDDSGTIELRAGVFSSLAEAMESLREVSSLVGTGSLQLVVSQPAARFFRLGAEAHLGWISFFAERDTLERLSRGRSTRFFLHPFLGPLSRRRKKSLAEYLRGNACGELWGEEELRWAGFKDRSFKFIGGTAYRPDIAGPARVCFEVRDAHRSLELLESRARRILAHWEREESGFARFAGLPAFDPEADFELLSAETREGLARVFPCRAPEALKAFPVSYSLHEVHRNFAYPLRPWAGWLEELGVSQEELRAHQLRYLEALREALAFPDSEAGAAVQAALARFAKEGPLLPAFLRKEAGLA